jgi:hypothetical protein
MQPAPALQPDCKRRRARIDIKEDRDMTTLSGWRKLMTFATIDALLILAATSAWAMTLAQR